MSRSPISPPLDYYMPPSADLDLEAAPYSGKYASIFSPRGRVGRVQLLAYNVMLQIAMAVFGIVVGVAIAATGGDVEQFSGLVLVTTIVPLFVSVPLWFIWCIKRCHDFERSGWWSLAGLIPLVALAFVVIPGTQGGNDYGFKRPNRWYHWLTGPGVFLLSVLVLLYLANYMPEALTGTSGL